jgi:LCP family protein required for cell wall assembly
MGNRRRTLEASALATRLRRLAVFFGVAGVLLVAISGWRAWSAYQDIQRVPFEDSASAAEVLSTIPDSEVEDLRAAEDAAEEAARLAEQLELEAELLAELEAQRRGVTRSTVEIEIPFVTSPELPDDMFASYLLVGVEGGFRADAIIYLLQPSNGSAPIMMSLPRDLYLRNPCTQRYTRINAGLGGCAGYAGGAELLSLMVKDFTGIEVDHFARVDFSGFERVINALGGVEICVENSVRDDKSFLDLPAGCSRAGGDQALAWVRSRRTEEFVDGEWRRVPGVSDFTRQQKQQDMLFKIAGRMNSFASFASFSDVASSLASTVALDAGFSFGDAVSLAWQFRGVDASGVNRISIPVRDYVTGEGAYVLVPTAPFNESLARVYPAAAR